MAKSKRFSIKELREWLYETATQMRNDDSFNTGTVYYKNLGCGVTVVMCWSETPDFEYELGHPFMRPDKTRMCCGKEIMTAYGLEVSLRETEPVSSWGNLPSDWLYWDSHLPNAEQGLEGSISLNQCDLDDKMSNMAHYLSAERTQFRKYHKT